eukprot:s2308_g16.t1
MKVLATVLYRSLQEDSVEILDKPSKRPLHVFRRSVREDLMGILVPSLREDFVEILATLEVSRSMEDVLSLSVQVRADLGLCSRPVEPVEPVTQLHAPASYSLLAITTLRLSLRETPDAFKQSGDEIIRLPHHSLHIFTAMQFLPGSLFPMPFMHHICFGGIRRECEPTPLPEFVWGMFGNRNVVRDLPRDIEDLLG